MQRMLTLNHRSLQSDRPLPVRPLPSLLSEQHDPSTCTAADSSSGSDGGGSSGSLADVHGYPLGSSPWLIDFAAAEHAEAVVRDVPAGIEELFLQTTRSLRDSKFPEARQLLHGACLRGQQLMEIWAQDTNSRLHQSASVLESWVRECALLLQYMPITAPNREDHKRLLMLLHDLGGTLLLTHLLGVLPMPLLASAPMAELANAILEFGEVPPLAPPACACAACLRLSCARLG